MSTTKVNFHTQFVPDFVSFCFFVDISSVNPVLSGRPVSLSASHVRDLSLLVCHSGLFFLLSFSWLDLPVYLLCQVIHCTCSKSDNMEGGGHPSIMGSAPVVPAAYALPAFILSFSSGFVDSHQRFERENPPLSAALCFDLLCGERSGADKGFPYQPGSVLQPV